MVSQGSLWPIFTRPVALILFLLIVWMFVSQTPLYKRFLAGVKARIFKQE